MAAQPVKYPSLLTGHILAYPGKQGFRMFTSVLKKKCLMNITRVFIHVFTMFTSVLKKKCLVNITRVFIHVSYKIKATFWLQFKPSYFPLFLSYL